MSDVSTQLKTKSLKNGFSWALIGNIVYGASQLLILSIIAKLGDNIMLGQFTLGVAIITPIAFLLNMNLRAVQATDLDEKYSFGDYLGLRFITNLIALLAIVAITRIVGYPIETSIVIILLGTYRLLEYLSDVFYGFWQHYERVDLIGKSTSIRNIIALIIFTITLNFTNSLAYSILGLILCTIIVILFFDIPVSIPLIYGRRNSVTLSQIAEFLKPQFCKTRMLSLVRISLPIGISWLFLSLSSNIPRYFVEAYHGVDQLGVFSAIAFLPTAGTTIVYALGQASLTRLSKHYASPDAKSFQQLLTKLIGVASSIGMCGVLAVFFFGKNILSIVYNESYAQQSHLLLLLMLWGTIYYVAWCFDYAATAAKKFRHALVVSMSKAFTVLLVSLLLIPKFGLLGASLVLLVDSLVQIIGMMLVVNSALNNIRHISSNSIS